MQAKVHEESVSMTIQVILNPAAAAGTAGAHQRELVALLDRHVVDYTLELTKERGDATVLARRALAGGATHIVAAGGDGTINEVINGFFEAGVPINPHAVFSVIPMGSGNDFLKSLGIADKMKEAILKVSEGEVRRIDVGSVAFWDAEGSPCARYFVNIADFGFSADVAAWFNAHRRAYVGKLLYFLATFAAWRTRRLYEVDAHIDGTPVHLTNVLLGVVCNGTTFGGGMKVAPRAAIDDGLFDVYLVRGVKFMKLLPMLNKVYRGEHQENDAILYFRATQIDVRVDTQSRVPLGMEGEQPGFLPASYTIMPGALNLKG
jgi:diacylglycerol kinase (ATP)